MAVKVIRKTNARGWAILESALRALKDIELKVGWFSTNRYENGVSVALVALVHEFGSRVLGIPPRPHMRPTIEREEENWRRFIVQESKKVLAGNQTVEGMFEALGLNASGEIAKTISEIFAPPLKPQTIIAKARKMAKSGLVGALDKPLVETGQMMETVTHTIGESE